MTESKRSKQNRKKRVLSVLAAAAVAGVSIAGIYGATELYDSFFRRYELPDYSKTPGLYTYERVKNVLPRELITFPSDGVTLQGYFYPAEYSNKMVVISHGMHAGADDYLPVALFFHENGYNVFSYDVKGTYRSEGDSTVGMCEPLVDLDHTLTFLENDYRFDHMKLYLFGHSWGGYAATAVLSLHDTVHACAAIAPFNSGYTLITEKGEQYAGELAKKGLSQPFLKIYQRVLFKDYVKYTGVDGINKRDIPVLIAHGRQDAVISFYHQSIIAHRDEINNPNVTYYVTDGLLGGHDSIWHSEDSVRYQKEFAEKIKQLKKNDGAENEALNALYAQANHELFSEINRDLLNNILEMFDRAA